VPIDTCICARIQLRNAAMQSERDFDIILGRIHTGSGILYFSLSLSFSPSFFVCEIDSRYVIVNPIDQRFAHMLRYALTVHRDIESLTYSAS